MVYLRVMVKLDDSENLLPSRAEWVKRRWLAAAGPLAIVACVLFLLRDFAFRGLLSTQHPDLIQQWLPFYCFLGKSISSGHVPLWNPYAWAGAPFAADPQSGWMYVPAMTLFASLPCNVALGVLIALQPILAGLGIYWFLRTEGISRPAASAGGLLMALMLSGSELALEIPFAGTLAWTALLLAATSRYLKARQWPRRLLWAAAAAICWGQVAMAHLSHGLVVGTGALVAYLVAKLVHNWRTGVLLGRDAAILGAVLIAILPLVNLAVLLPRIAYLPRTTLGLGYDGMNKVAAGLTGHATPKPIAALSNGPRRPSWPLSSMVAPGAYLGLTATALSWCSLWDRRFRHLVLAFFTSGLLFYVLSLPVVAARLAGPLRSVPLSDFYQHALYRFTFGVRFALVILIALGVEAWCVRWPAKHRAIMLASGIGVWWLGAVLAGRFHPGSLLLTVGLVLGGTALLASARRSELGMLIPIAIGVELFTNALMGQGALAKVPAELRASGNAPLRRPTVSGSAYLRATSTERLLQVRAGQRYVTLSRAGLELRERSLLASMPAGWNAAADQRAMLFRLEDSDAYNPTQLLRYWTLVRALTQRTPSYNTSYFTTASPVAFNLLDVGWIVGRASSPPPLHAKMILSEGGWTLYQLIKAPPRVSVFSTWTSAHSAAEALAVVRSSDFNPMTKLVVEGLDQKSQGGRGGTATYQATGPESARIGVETRSSALVLVRNMFDVGWVATVDGHPARVLAADYVDQAILVPSGAHTIELRFEDPSIGPGMLGSGITLGALMLAAFMFAWSGKRPGSTRVTQTSG